MATYTPNLGLTKPDGTDSVNIADLNENFDKIDEQVQKIASTFCPQLKYGGAEMDLTAYDYVFERSDTNATIVKLPDSGISNSIYIYTPAFNGGVISAGESIDLTNNSEKMIQVDNGTMTTYTGNVLSISPHAFRNIKGYEYGAGTYLVGMRIRFLPIGDSVRPIIERLYQ